RGFTGWGRVSPWVSGRRGLSGRYSGVQAGPGASGGIGSQPKVPTPRSLARLLADDRFQVGGQRSESAGVHGRGGPRGGGGGFRVGGVWGGRGLGALRGCLGGQGLRLRRGAGGGCVGRHVHERAAGGARRAGGGGSCLAEGGGDLGPGPARGGSLRGDG